tara:strand:- start:152 stop:499 length:348 start_codon:yes stop_codon:yes gene_type:complete
MNFYRQTDHLNQSELEYLLKICDPENSAYWVLEQMLLDRQKADTAYLDNIITAAEYTEDLYEEEYATAIVEKDVSAGPWVYSGEQKIPNFDVTERTHSDFGFVGKLPGTKRKITK